MYKRILMFAGLSAALTLMAEPVADVSTDESAPPPRREKGEGGRGRYREMTPEQREEMQERRLQFLEETLTKISVNEEQRAKIMLLQEKIREEMRSSHDKVAEARDALSALQDEGASKEAIYAAIDEVSSAQAEQMKILARSRMEMESVLGAEKYRAFMDSARMKWREHGHRSNSGMPPKPGLPPYPKKESAENAPPAPPERTSVPQE